MSAFGGKADILFATGLGALGLLGWRRQRKNALTKLFQNGIPVERVSSVSKEAAMLESEKFRRYAKDCIRIAATMNGKDRETLLAIAEAWEARAAEAEGRQYKTDGGAGPEGPKLPV